MPKIQVSMMLVQGLVTAVERAGFDRKRFVSDSGLADLQLDDVLARLPLEDYEYAIGIAYKTVGDPAFGLHHGERMSLGAFDVLGHLAEHSASLRDAIQLVLRYSGYITDGPRLVFEEQEDTAILSFELPESHSRAALLTSEFATVTMLRLFRSFVGDDAVPHLAFFVHEAPSYREEYQRIFACDLLFSHAFTGLAFDRSWLDHAPAFRKAELHELLLKRGDMLLARTERKMAWAETLCRCQRQARRVARHRRNRIAPRT